MVHPVCSFMNQDDYYLLCYCLLNAAATTLAMICISLFLYRWIHGRGGRCGGNDVDAAIAKDDPNDGGGAPLLRRRSSKSVSSSSSSSSLTPIDENSEVTEFDCCPLWGRWCVNDEVDSDDHHQRPPPPRRQHVDGRIVALVAAALFASVVLVAVVLDGICSEIDRLEDLLHLPPHTVEGGLRKVLVQLSGTRGTSASVQ
mmetsp:Transcript_13662/g.32045  ORF Transcript_13662/g.32045 Transcript_13662/m.32045 type:complete len:200 (-) Transcript_13662:1141-1740(-)